MKIVPETSVQTHCCSASIAFTNKMGQLNYICEPNAAEVLHRYVPCSSCSGGRRLGCHSSSGGSPAQLQLPCCHFSVRKYAGKPWREVLGRTTLAGTLGGNPWANHGAALNGHLGAGLQGREGELGFAGVCKPKSNTDNQSQPHHPINTVNGTPVGS